MVTVMKAEAIGRDWVGQAIDGRIRLIEWLGGSESSGVFLAELPGDPPRKAAIRLVPADGADADAQIARWQAAVSLSHPHLMRLLHCGRCQIDAIPLIYAVTEYAEENLAQVLPERPLTPVETREMLGPVLDALAYLHEKSLVHGGLKPSNILVVDDQVKLSIEEVQAAGTVNRPAQTLGIHDAPECAGGTISPAADVWSLGVMLVEALTQHPPVWERSAQSDPVVQESMPEPFAGIAREALRTEPARRCSLGEIGNRLDGVQSARNEAGAEAGGEGAKLRWAVLAAAAIVVIALIAIFYPRSPQTESPQPAAVEQQTEPAITKPSASSPAPESQRSKPAVAPAVEPAVEPVPVSAPVNNAAVVEQVLPEVSAKAMASIHGQFGVRVRVEVDAAGAVSDATLDSPGPSQYFAQAALEAARHWKFKPVQVKGQPVASVWMLQFQFKQSGPEVTAGEVSP